MHDFIGRVKELDVLEKSYRSKRSGFIPIYGRRRVGKSELILQFVADKPCIYYLGKQAPPQFQMREFLQESVAVLGEPLLGELSPHSWKDVFKTVTERWGGPGRLIIALDEFQWMVGSSPELPSILQECWDRHWKDSGKIQLILCGSYIGFMEKEILGRKSPLFGRRTGQIVLKPFSYLESRKFHPSYSLRDCARTYFICGGIPLYLNQFSKSLSVEMNIEKNLLNEYSVLYKEPDFLLREELREVENYYIILCAMAGGSLTAKAISTRTGINDRGIFYYLQQLVDLGYISRHYPLTENKPAARHVRFVLEDPLLKFWFRFIYQNTSFIVQGGPQKAFRERIGPELESYFGHCFERLCREALPLLYDYEGVNASFEIGEYWDKSTQIDLVGIRDDNWIDLGECKWGKVRSVSKLYSELQFKVESYPNPRNATIQRRIFTRCPMRKKKDDAQTVSMHCLKDLYSL